MPAVRTQVVPERSWRKVLYVDQGVPDNYVPPTFLTEMKKNLYLREYSYWGLVLASGRIAQQIGCVAAFVAVYALLLEGAIDPLVACAAPAALTASVFAAAAALLGRAPQSPGAAAAAAADAATAAGTAAVFALAAFVLSPILMTLTSAISTDTVYAMAAAMLLVHLVSRDYDDGAALASDSTSFNAAVFASVCLASRLPSAVHAFSLVLLAVQMLAVWPQAARHMRRRGCSVLPPSPHGGGYWAADVLVTAVVASLASLALLLAAPAAAAAVLLAAVMAFVTFVCPMWLLRLQPYKDNIYGPWDEATILK